MTVKNSRDNAQTEATRAEMDREYQRKAALLQKQNKAYNDYCAENNLKKRADRIAIAKWDRQQAAQARGAAKRYNNAVEKSENSDTIKSLDLDDLEIKSINTTIKPEVIDLIGNTIKNFERQGGMYISDAHFGDFYDEVTGSRALFQVFIGSNQLTQININSSVLGGRTIEEINEIISSAKTNLPQNLVEAIVHECGHAKLYYHKTMAQASALNVELLNKGVEGISNIAANDGAECIAEVEVLLYRKSVVPEEAMNLYNEYLKGK